MTPKGHAPALIMKRALPPSLFLVILVVAEAVAQSNPDLTACALFSTPRVEIFERCTRAIESGRLTDAERVLAYTSRGGAWHANRNLDKALADYEAALAINSTHVETLRRRTFAWRAKGQLDRAIKDYDLIISVKPNDSDMFIGRGVIWDEKGDPERAIADFTRAIELAPGSALAFYNRSLVRKTRGDMIGSAADYAEARRLDPKIGIPR